MPLRPMMAPAAAARPRGGRGADDAAGAVDAGGRVGSGSQPPVAPAPPNRPPAASKVVLVPAERVSDDGESLLVVGDGSRQVSVSGSYRRRRRRRPCRRTCSAIAASSSGGVTSCGGSADSGRTFGGRGRQNAHHGGRVSESGSTRRRRSVSGVMCDTIALTIATVRRSPPWVRRKRSSRPKGPEYASSTRRPNDSASSAGPDCGSKASRCEPYSTTASAGVGASATSE